MIGDDDKWRAAHSFAELQLEAEQRHFPEGFEPGRSIVALATEETRTYFLITYNLEAKS